MKNNIEYYQHFVNSHTHGKFKTLRVKYGWEGEGKFWALNNMIADSENCKLDLSKTYLKSSIAIDLNFTIDQFDEFISYLYNECKLINIRKGILTTGITQENLERVMADRQRARKRVSGEKEKSSGEKLSYSAEQNKKEKKIKLNKIKIKEEDQQQLNNILTQWNVFAHLNHLPLCMKLTSDRINTLLQRMKEPEFKFEDILNKIKISNWLMSKIPKLNLDFIINNDSNYIKILEGKFINEEKQTSTGSGKRRAGQSLQFIRAANDN